VCLSWRVLTVGVDLSLVVSVGFCGRFWMDWGCLQMLVDVAVLS
jgi:hypothetical protein